VYLPETSVNLKYEIFQVLNQGATMLKPQEIRNCLLASEMPNLNKLLKVVANKLRKITGMTLDRMLGEELALRFFVINKYGYERDITDLLNNFKMLKRDFDDPEIRRMKQKSESFFRTLKKIFNNDIDDCFQVLQKGVKPPKINKWGLYPFSKKINQSLFHLLSCYLPKFSTHQLNSKNFIKIKKGYLALLKNKSFISVVTGSGTNSTRNIKKSNHLFKKVFLEKYVGDWTVKSKRNITTAEKRTIRKNVPYCYLCYGKIRNNLPIGKIHAEHIEAYSSGKKSKLSNVLLAHPKCNAEKKDMTLDEYRETTKSQKRRKKQKKNIMSYRQALKEWNKAYKLDIYSRLMKFAKADISL
jgi:5-methylcytosine-specific restriction endonuclease McrA